MIDVLHEISNQMVLGQTMIYSNIYSVTIAYRVGIKQGIAEASSVYSAQPTPLGNIKDIYYFNRIFVPEGLRGYGIGTLLLDELLSQILLRNVALACDINPYGDMSEAELFDWYVRHGFGVYYDPIIQENRLWFNA